MGELVISIYTKHLLCVGFYIYIYIYFQVFYVYMYLLSFLFVMYVNVFILKRQSRLTRFFLAVIGRIRSLLRNEADKSGVAQARNRHLSTISRCSFSTDTTNFVYTGSFPLRVGAVGELDKHVNSVILTANFVIIVYIYGLN